MNKWVVCLALCLLSTVVVAFSDAALVYNQPTDLNGGYFSQNDTTGGFGNYATAYDNFTLSQLAVITDVSWVGSYANPPTQGTITAFTVDFWADNSGQPGALLQTESLLGNAGETSLGLDNFNNPTFGYSAVLPTSFTASAGTTYWMSIVPDLGLPPQWAWETATGGDGIAYQDFFGTRYQLAVDFAFTLNSGEAAVPEPSALMVWSLLSVVGISVAWWRRRRKAA